MSELWTTAEVAERFKVTAQTVRAWARTGLLPATHTNGQRSALRFRREDVEAHEKKFPACA